MAAMNGSARRPRSRAGFLGLALAVTFALSALFASSAGAVIKPIKTQYLALGDSLAFGYSQQLYNENEAKGDPATAFEHGYVHYYYNHMRPLLNGIGLVNDGCPGETTDSLIGNGPLGKALEGFGATTEAPCGYSSIWNALHKNGLGGPLHNEYAPAASQLENALQTIAVGAATGKPVTTVSLNIGANDELHSIKKCEEKAKKEVEEKVAKGEIPFEEPLDKHVAEGLTLGCIKETVKPLFEHILNNLGIILFTLREGEKFGGVNYGGKIVFQGSYDPFGNVFGKEELLTKSTELASALNGLEEKEVLPKFGACFANPFPKFNPLNSLEPRRLRAWTNMANFTEFEGKKNGPDIHPTPAGYRVLSQVMIASCG
jgi:hypothetical protein